MNKSAFHKLSYGVYVVSTWDNGRPTGCTANSAMQITSEPATIAVSINHDNYTNKCIQESGRFAISILGENSSKEESLKWYQLSIEYGNDKAKDKLKEYATAANDPQIKQFFDKGAKSAMENKQQLMKFLG